MSVSNLSKENFKAILDINKKINTIDDVRQVLNDISIYTSDLVEAEETSILLVDPETEDLYFEVASGDNIHILSELKVPKGEGIAGFAASNQKSVIVNEADKDKRFYKGIDDKTNMKTKNILAAPMIYHQKTVGVLEAVNSKRGYFNEADVALIEQFASQAAIAVVNALLYKEAQNRFKEQELLYQIGNVTNMYSDEQNIYDEIVKIIAKAFNSGRVSIMIIDEESKKLKIKSSIGINDEIVKKVENAPESSKISSRVFFTGEMLSCNDLKNSSFYLNGADKVYLKDGFISTPIKTKNISVGVINITNPFNEMKYTAETIPLLKTISNQIGYIYDSIQRYKEKIEQERVQKEISIMRSLQDGLLTNDFKTMDKLDYYASTKPAEEVSGDFYDIYPFSCSKVGMIIGDVSGKGLPASLFMAVSRSVIKSYAFQKLAPGNLLQTSNKVIFDDSKAGMFVTAFYVFIDLDEMKIQYSDAGHNMQYIYRPSTQEFHQLHAEGIPLGVFDDTAYQTLEFDIQKNDLLISFTDGLVEAQNSREEEFGLEHIQKIIREYSFEKPEKIIKRLAGEAENWAINEKQWDDITLLICRIL